LKSFEGRFEDISKSLQSHSLGRRNHQKQFCFLFRADCRGHL